jgi:general L-amino acid transport system permease protein
MNENPQSPPQTAGSPLADVRVWQIVVQIVFAVAVVTAFAIIATNVLQALAANNATPNFNFLTGRAGFDISERPTGFTPDSNYLEAFLVGLVNTVRISITGIVMATLFGVFLGIFLLSGNFLLRTLARVYVEAMRNIPLLIHLFIWYYIVIASFPALRDSLAFPAEGINVIPARLLLYVLLLVGVWLAPRFIKPMPNWATPAVLIGIVVIELLSQANILPTWELLRFEAYPLVFGNIRGIVFPDVLPTARFGAWLLIVLAGIASTVGLLWFLGRVTERTGRQFPSLWIAVGILALATIGGWFAVSAAPAPTSVIVNGQTVTVVEGLANADPTVALETELAAAQIPVGVRLPSKNNFRFLTGTVVSPEFMALLLGLVFYTSAYIGEIVRAGIQAISFGQVEAGRALGLSYSKILRMVILPQALRVIIPPLGNQYLNLAKNSSLAISIAFSDLYLVTTTIMNQSGQSVPGMGMLMVAYLALSLTISLAMNLLNGLFKIQDNRPTQPPIWQRLFRATPAQKDKAKEQTA